MTYLVKENRNIGVAGAPSFVESTIFVGTLEECVLFETEKRKEYRMAFGDEFGAVVDCHTVSAEEQQKIDEAVAFYDSLTEEQKNEKIVVDGKTYIKAVYERTHK